MGSSWTIGPDGTVTWMNAAARGPEDYAFADAVLAKPFAFDEPRVTLARVLNGR